MSQSKILSGTLILASVLGAGAQAKETEAQEIIGNFPASESSVWGAALEKSFKAAAHQKPTNPLLEKIRKDLAELQARKFFRYTFGHYVKSFYRVREFVTPDLKRGESYLSVEQAFYLNKFPIMDIRYLFMVDVRDFEDNYEAYRSVIVLKMKWSGAKKRKALKAEYVDYDFDKVSINSLGGYLDFLGGAKRMGMDADYVERLTSDTFLNETTIVEPFLYQAQVKHPSAELKKFLDEVDLQRSKGLRPDYGQWGSHLRFQFIESPVTVAAELRRTGNLRLRGQIYGTWIDNVRQKQRVDRIDLIFTLTWSETKQSVEVLDLEFEKIERGPEEDRPPAAGGGGAVTAD